MPVQQSDIETIFIEAAAIDASAERNAFLVEKCGDDQQLRRRVEALLRAHNDAGSFLDGPPEDVLPTIAINSKDTVDEGLGPISLDFLNECDTPNRLGALGQYEVIEVIGRGGMGLVLRAHDTKLNRVVAIKVMAPELAANPMAVKRFLREAEAAAAVTHDHVVSIHAIEDDVTPPYLVMEFVDGVSLQDKIDRQGALELREILRIGMQTASGLAAAHKQGLVHRDIKPANILLENGVERVKITDFGLARAVDDVNITRTGMIAGTPQYMSPEQAQGHAIDHRSDLFALGSVLYAMCTGRPAFRADNPLAVMRRVCDDEPRAIQEINADTPDWLCAIIEKLLAKDAGERFQTSDEVAELLSKWLAHVQQPALIPPPEQLPRRADRRAGSVSSLKRRGDQKKHGANTSGKSIQPAYTGRSPMWPLIAVASALLLMFVLFGAVVMIATDRGVLEVRSEVGDVQVSVTKNGEEVAIVDVATGSKIKWLASDDYEVKLVGDDNDIKLDKSGFEMSRLGRIIVTAKWKDDDAGVIKRFAADEETITKDGVAAADGGWKLTADKTRTVRLFETPLPELKPGKFFYHAKIKTENVKDRAYLEMWVRFPGQGEFFSKGFQNAVSGTNGWSEYQIPFLVDKDGQKPDFVKLNVVIEGGGTVWIKDIALRGRVVQSDLGNSNDSRDKIELARELRGHADAIQDLEVTRNGKWLISAGAGEIIVRDGKTYEVVRTIETERDRTRVISTNPDATRLATGGHDGTLEVYDLATGERQLQQHLGRQWIEYMEWSPDGKSIVIKVLKNPGGGFAVWDVETEKVIRSFEKGAQAFIFSPDGKRVAAGNRNGIVTLFDFASGKVVHELDHAPNGRVRAMTFVPDGSQILTGGDDNNAKLWDVESGRLLAMFAHEDGVHAAAFLPDGRHVVFGLKDARQLTVWDLKTTRRVTSVDGVDVTPSGFALLRDGRHLVTARAEYQIPEGQNEPGVIQIWRLAEGADGQKGTITETRRLPGTASANSAVAWPTADRIISGTHLGVAVWNSESGELLAELHDRLPADKKPVEDGQDIAPSITYSLATTADGKLAATGHYRGMVCIWDLEGQKQLHRIPAHWSGDRSTSGVYGVAFTADDRHLVTGGADGKIRVWNVATGEMVIEHKFGKRVRALTMHPDGRRILAGSFPSNGVSRLTLLHWATGEVVHELDNANTGVFALAISPDGRLAVSGSNQQSPARVWDLETGKQLHLLKSQTDTVESIAFTPDGRHIVCGTNDRKLRVYDVQSGREIFQHTADTHSTRYVAMSPDGNQLVTGGGKFWNYKSNGLVTDGDNDLRLWRFNHGVEEGDWTPLFNGRDLTGWQTHPEQPDGWRVEDGVLIGDGGVMGHLFTEDGAYDNFHLRAEVKINDHGNGGIYFRCDTNLAKGRKEPTGYEAQILSGDYVSPTGWHEKQKTGSLFNLVRVEEPTVPPDEWFTLDVIARDYHIVIKVNGETTADYIDSARTHTRGHIALQQMPSGRGRNPTLVQFRKIEIKDLSESDVPFSCEGDLDPIAEFNGHTDWISAVAYTSDGEQIVTSGHDETIRVWKAATGELLRTIDTHNAPLSIAVSPDNRYVVAGTYQANVVMWDLETGKIVRPFVGHELSDHGTKVGRMLSVAFSADGKILASCGDDGTVRLWNVESGKQLQKLAVLADLPADLPVPPVETVVFSSDGKTVLASDYSGTVRQWNVTDGKLIKTLRGQKHAAISPDGKWLAAGHKLFNAETNEHVCHLPYDEGGNAVSIRFMPDSRRVVIGKSDGSLWVYDVPNGRVIAKVVCNKHITNVIDVSPDGQFVATGGGAKWSNDESEMIRDGDYALRVWQLPEDVAPLVEFTEIGRCRGHERSIFHVAYAPNGKLVYSVDGDTLRQWNAATGELVRTIEVPEGSGWADSVAVSPDNKFVLTGHAQGKLTLWNAEPGELVRQWSPHKFRVDCVAFTPDGKYAVSACATHFAEGDAGPVKVFRTSDWEVAREFHVGQSGDVYGFAVHPDSRHVLLSTVGPLQLRNLETGELIRTLDDGPGTQRRGVDIDDTGRWAVTGSNNSKLVLWDLATSEEVRRFHGHGHNGPRVDGGGIIARCAFVPGTNWIVSSGWDRTLRLWDRETGIELARDISDTQSNQHVAISPDGRHAVTGGGNAKVGAGKYEEDGDFELRIWQLPSSLIVESGASAIRQLRRIGGHKARITAIRLSPDGKNILSLDVKGQLNLWDATTFKPLGQWQTKFDDSGVEDARFTAEGSEIITRDAFQLRFWSLEGREIRKGRVEQWMGQNMTFAASPGGKQLATIDGDHPLELKLFDAETGELVGKRGIAGSAKDMRYSPDGKRIFIGGAGVEEDVVYALDIESDQTVWNRSLKPLYVYGLTVSPDGKYVAAGGRGSQGSSAAFILDAASGEVLHELNVTESVRSLQFTTDSGHLLTGSDDRILRRWDVLSGKVLNRAEAKCLCLNRMVLLDDGRTVVTGGGIGQPRGVPKTIDDGDYDLRVWHIPETSLEVDEPADVRAEEIDADVPDAVLNLPEATANASIDEIRNLPDALGDAKAATRETALEQLFTIGREGAAEEAMRVLLAMAWHDKENDLAADAALAVGELGEENVQAAQLAVPVLVRMVGDRTRAAAVREAAARAIGEIGERHSALDEIQSAAAPLARAVKGDSDEVARRALWTLEEIAKNNARAVQPAKLTLRRVANEHASDRIRRSATVALGTIGCGIGRR